MTRTPIAQATLDREDALARGRELIAEIRALLRTAKKKRPVYRELMTAFDLGGEGSGNFGHAGRPGEVGGSAPGGGSGSRDERRESVKRQFQALIDAKVTGLAEVDTLRTDLNAAWKVWSDEISNRPKPLKPDGAAAKKLDSYKQARALEEAFHARYQAESSDARRLDAEAKALLRVPVEERSAVVFKVDDQEPVIPERARAASNALATLRTYDGSGAFVPVKFPADKVEALRTIFGDKTTLTENADGTFSIPTSLTLGTAKDGRAHATMAGIHIAGGRELDRQVHHEVAHHIEIRNPAVLKAAVALRESLADSPREVYKLNTVNRSLGSDEEALRGKFPDPYTAKLYPRDIATEIVSTGVESYIADPIRFAQERPEHFAFIFDVLHGKYREAE